MIRRPPRSTLDRSSAASDVYKRQGFVGLEAAEEFFFGGGGWEVAGAAIGQHQVVVGGDAVSYTHLRAHETVLDLVCRLLLEKKKNRKKLIAANLLLYL